MSSDVLAQIVATTRGSVAARRQAVPLSTLLAAGEQRRAGGDARDFRAALAKPGLSMIAEHKRSSPSAGVIRADLELADVVRAYQRAGASALSILTEETRFGGRLEDLATARTAAALPILRKDFVVDEYQLYEALAGGADAVLLIVAALEVGPLADLHALAGRLGLAALVEVHNAAELAIAAGIGAEIIGINNRNLSTLQVDTATTYELLPQIPAGSIRVAESGFRTREELEQLRAAGVDAVLIGEALMRSPDIEAAARELLGANI
ncbi:MAG TPA: indole-3-glycerol phosphate synthase TrpC [Solirubrobacteraceae bacterium]|nr:indole-3-glycerol phosphate synthase TrpC [Solirubrobacteraceae bacterium]